MTKPHALVVDDDRAICDSVADTLELLVHTGEYACCVEEARQLLEKRRFDYILLDLELPVRAGTGIPRIQNGESLLEEIHAHPKQAGVPVIVMTGHGRDSPSLGVRMMKKGAVDFVTKPFPTEGETLEKAIKEALTKRRQAQPQAASGTHVAEPAPVPPAPKATSSPRQAEGTPQGAEVEMVFWPARVELCGVKVCGAQGSGMMRRMLDALKKRKPTGQYETYSGKKLADAVGTEGGQNAVAQCVAKFRDEVVRLFPATKSLPFPPKQVIVSGGPGYRLHPKIVVKQGDS
jgi:FixJ family two-component response regulator